MSIRFRSLVSRSAEIFESAPFAYASIFTLQIRAIWGMWWVRDLTSGDTSEYFARGYGWFQAWSNNIAWSPLYTTFYGSLLYLSRDAYVVTIAHRLIIVLSLALLVLALMRRLMAPWAAWMVTAWWVVLPINYDTLYEVHLFLAIPLVVAGLLLARSTPAARGTALAVLLGTTLLMRNEIAIATAGLALLCAVTETRVGWRQRSRVLLSGYGVPLLVVGMIVALSYGRSTVKYPQLAVALERKHTLNVCQIFAYGYQQRHPEWSSSPWTECQELMVRTFGTPEMAMFEAMRRRPGAMWDHFRWNVGLIPNGVQLLLFNAASGRVNPDYAPAALLNRTARNLSMLWLAMLVGAGICARREWPYWWRTWIAPRGWVWSLLGLLAVTATVVMVTQRPRPSYLFSLAVGCMALTGLAVQVIVWWFGVTEGARQLLPAAVVVLHLALPTYATRNAGTPRPLLENYRRIVPFVDSIRDSEPSLVTSGFPNELCNYFAYGGRCVDYYALRAEVTPETPWPQVLERHKVGLVYLSEGARGDPTGHALATAAGPISQVAGGVSERGPWAILRVASSR